MIAYLLRRLGFLLLTLLVTSLIIFAVTQFLPGDVCRVILGREAGEAALESCRQRLGLDEPLPLQYLSWLGNFVGGDWGESFSTRSDIRPLVLERLRNSLRLALVTMLVAVPLAIFLGVVAGLNEDKALDNVISIASLSVVGLPEFVTGLVLIHLLAFGLNSYLEAWFGVRPFQANASVAPDASFGEVLPYLVLPALTATLVLLAYIARLTRAGVVEELQRPYVRTATLKGLPRRTVIIKHVLRNALLPTITVIAISFGWLISGLIVIDNVFK
ncbi:MAG TPA: ABC transporter permease [Candidatus Sulfomarinibacteraceae bacterium]|nr:ABC transporter permease [Candidatus Sulfomarinibacteraceae bacterium]